MSWIRVGALVDFPPGSVRAVHIDGENVMLCRVSDNEIYAIENACSHDGATFDEGTLMGRQLECPRHGARFDVSTGAALRMPAVSPVQRYETRIAMDGSVEIDLED